MVFLVLLLLDALVKLGASLDTHTQQARLVASLSASDSGHGHGMSVASCNRCGCGCRSWFGTGLEPERSYVHLNSACEQLIYGVSARETYFGRAKEAVAFSASAVLPFSTLH